MMRGRAGANALMLSAVAATLATVGAVWLLAAVRAVWAVALAMTVAVAGMVAMTIVINRLLADGAEADAPAKQPSDAAPAPAPPRPSRRPDDGATCPSCQTYVAELGHDARRRGAPGAGRVRTGGPRG